MHHYSRRTDLPPRDPSYFWHLCSGVIHVGANRGQERDNYAALGLKVIWIEADPAIYQLLVGHIADYPEQAAINALVTDCDGQTYAFHVANNEGHSSSIFDLHLHREVWPDVHYVEDIRLSSETLPTAIRSAGISPLGYDVLVIDTQGSELLVLRGAAELIPGFKWILVEAADFEAYKGAATGPELVEYLRPFGFVPVYRHLFSPRSDGTGYYNVLFERRSIKD